ncbi:hypothetical protein ACA910_015878 [Epithemia clementina (nom. ined.)]
MSSTSHSPHLVPPTPQRQAIFQEHPLSPFLNQGGSDASQFSDVSTQHQSQRTNGHQAPAGLNTPVSPSTVSHQFSDVFSHEQFLPTNGHQVPAEVSTSMEWSTPLNNQSNHHQSSGSGGQRTSIPDNVHVIPPHGSDTASMSNTSSFGSHAPSYQESAPSPPAANSRAAAIVSTQPCAALYSWCFQAPRRVSVGQENYLTWPKIGQGDHNPRFTSLFVHPVSKEAFSSGRFGDPSDYEVEGDIVWYTKQKMARHGAAARAYDCLTFREARRTGITYARIGDDEPTAEPVPLPAGMPDYIRAQLSCG